MLSLNLPRCVALGKGAAEGCRTEGGICRAMGLKPVAKAKGSYEGP